MVLTEEGYVYTFGLNTFHQLGLTPPPASSHVPKQVRLHRPPPVSGSASCVMQNL